MPKLEEKQYVCLCGGREFQIFKLYLECSQCGQRYNYYHGFLLDPTDYNGRRESLKRKEK